MPVRIYYILWVLIGSVYLCNLPVDVMEVDAAQYASMSVEMQSNTNALHVYHRGNDYLDKPPLLFWLSSFSFRMFGIGNVAYKLAALLALILGLWSTYRFTLLYYSKEAAYMAVTILGCTQAFFLMTNDVRTDGLLTGFIMFAVLQCALFLEKRRFVHLLCAGAGIGFAMMAKGPVGAVIPALAIGGHLILQRKWRDLFAPQWIIVAVIALVVLVPMCYGLYTQFDLHPEKVVYGLQGPSGLKFFFWTQSFGRVTGDIYWNNNAPFYFFLLTFLWDFMPWIAIFIPAMFYALRFRKLIKNPKAEFITVMGFILSMCMLSLSRYKLPHYIFPLFPFAAVMTARYLSTQLGEKRKFILIVHFILTHFLVGLVVFGFIMVFPPVSVFLPILLIALYAAMWWLYKKYSRLQDRLIITGAMVAVIFNLFMSLQFYPHLMRYQAGSAAGREIYKDKQYHQRTYYAYAKPAYSLDFYAQGYAEMINRDDLVGLEQGSWVYIPKETFEELQPELSSQFRIVREFDNYHVSMLRLKFVLKHTRSSQLKRNYIVEKM